MFDDNRILFQKFVKVNSARNVYPWPLTIVDCFNLVNAFSEIDTDNPIALRRVWGCSDEDSLVLTDAYSLYDADRLTHGSEVAIMTSDGEAYCYWDLHERFVLAVGPSAFLKTARPFPSDIERHRYVEEMQRCDYEDWDDTSAPTRVYDELLSYYQT